MEPTMSPYITIRFPADAAANPGPPDAQADAWREERIPVQGETLAQAIYLSGFVTPPALCSALGRCGRCRVRYLVQPPAPLAAEAATLSHHDLDAGWRLACRRPPEAGLHLLLPATSRYAGTKAQGQAATAAPEHPALAVDIGTTSVHWRACGASARAAVEHAPAGVGINPQMGAGSDIMSRLAYAANPEGASRLQSLVLGSLRNACAAVREAWGKEPEELCLAANPAMTCIALGQETTGLARAPYHLNYRGGVAETLAGLPPLWIPPQISPFIGGDSSAGYAALALNPTKECPEFPFLLADLGTNGEFLLALSPTETLAASVPMGPSLEGIGLSFGMEAAFGAVTGYSISPLGLESQVLGDTAPKGISGTGYLSLAHALIQVGLLSRDGHFTPPTSPLARRVDSQSASNGLQELAAPSARQEARLRLPGRMALAATDVEELIKVKAAFNCALSRLFREAGLRPAALRGVFLAGAFGEHVPLAALENLGFLPSGLGGPVRPVGNSALEGAALFLSTPTVREPAVAWAREVHSLDLASDPGFMEAYTERMVFSWVS